MLKRSRPESASSSEEEPDHLPRASRSISVETPSIKYSHLDNTSSQSTTAPVMRCLLPPHQPLAFSTFDEYEVHYQQTHVNRCSECRKNFPSEHYLYLHIAENHDPLADARRARGEKTYGCFLPECDRLCRTAHTRRLHCIDKHSFPKMYDFFIVNDGIDRRNSMLRPHHGQRRSSTTNSSPEQKRSRRISADAVTSPVDPEAKNGTPASAEKMDVDVASCKTQKEGSKTKTPTPPSDADMKPTPPTGSSKKPDRDVDSITNSMSSLRFVPPSIKFGRGRGRGGFARQ